MTNKVKDMSAVVEQMSAIVRAAAEPWQPGDSIKAGVNRAARRLNLSPRRATTLWYARPCAVLADEADRLRLWYHNYLLSEAARLELRAAELRQRAQPLEEQRIEAGLRVDYGAGDVGR